MIVENKTLLPWQQTAKKNLSECEEAMNSTSQEEFNKHWNKHCQDLKIQQAFDKLQELGYYHDSGLYGWLKNKPKLNNED